MNTYKESTAVISACGKYRYLLRRVWDDYRIRALFVMLNPSTADGESDDPTIRSCVRLSKELSFGSIEVVNLFSYRSSSPKSLLEVDDPIGSNNDNCIRAAVKRCDLIICAWGAHQMAIDRGNTVMSEIRFERPAVFCFGVTKEKQPKHPLYVKSGTPLVVYG